METNWFYKFVVWWAIVGLIVFVHTRPKTPGQRILDLLIGGPLVWFTFFVVHTMRKLGYEKRKEKVDG